MVGKKEPFFQIKDLTLGYGGRVVLCDLNFTVNRGDIFVIMGASGCGKSTIMRSMIGLMRPESGRVIVDGIDLWSLSNDERARVIETFGISYQGGALFSSMTVRENVALPLELKTNMTPREINEQVNETLKLVGMDGYQNLYPPEISGGMIKRTALARAMILNPRVLFFDEPSAGLDPVHSANLDGLIQKINRTMGTTIIMVTHELPTIMTIATNSVYIDSETRTVGATGAPKQILKTTKNRKIIDFLTRNKTYMGAGK
ncbi:MAG: ATP-binding cassette domain-containing protein [Alphaproteobacteria bacterium]|nr:ATP-binding cassette domain-containing protein [Alphaproteobacteria bacterium]